MMIRVTYKPKTVFTSARVYHPATNAYFCHNITSLLKEIVRRILIFIIALSALKASAQGIGGGVIYNLPTSNVGFDIRYEYPKRQFVFSPQASYFPGFGPITEFNIGGAVHYIPFNLGKALPYGLVFGGYNGWISHASSPQPDAQFSNWSVETGVGITTRSCIRPFAEWRYSVKWGESNIRAGVIFTFNCGGYVCQTYI